MRFASKSVLRVFAWVMASALAGCDAPSSAEPKPAPERMEFRAAAPMAKRQAVTPEELDEMRRLAPDTMLLPRKQASSEPLGR